ncbi:MAG: type II toxin-antitoxin system HicB family antitoxin [bacterium]|nr:type II toxin-antitoxin system HicB family antitoxin [bacterium]MDZ4285127.1 type II toxin-antitoxin system HicB family antitoxin [Patescibacteria group bacterium]
MESHTYRVIIEPDERKTFHAYAPALPGCHTWGYSFEEARSRARDAIDAYLRSIVADGEKIPTDAGVEIIETVATPMAARRVLTHA